MVTQAWVPNTLQVFQFEKVTWSWAFNLEGGITPRIQITGTAADDSQAFQSEEVNSRSGSIFVFINVAPGTYTYSSGIQDDETTEFTGVIEVLPPKEFSLSVILTVAGPQQPEVA